MGGCQNYGLFLGPLNTRCRIILRTQKGTIILTTTLLSALSILEALGESSLHWACTWRAPTVEQLVVELQVSMDLHKPVSKTDLNTGHQTTSSQNMILPSAMLHLFFACL